MRAGALAADRRLDRRILPADDHQPLTEVHVRLVEVVADVRQVLARNPEKTRPVHRADREDDVLRAQDVARVL